MSDRIVARILTTPNVKATAIGSSSVQASAIGVSGGIRMTDLNDVTIADAVTGALMTYDATKGGFVVTSVIEAPDLKLVGGAF